MKKSTTKAILIVGGNNKAIKLTNEIAKTLYSKFISRNIILFYSLSGATKNPITPENTTDITVIQGSIGGIEGLRKLIKSNNIFLIIDALHPFAVNMRFNIQEVAWIENIDILHLEQKFWIPKPGDAWIVANNFYDAIKQIQRYNFGRPFIALGGRLNTAELDLINTLTIDLAFCRGVNWHANYKNPNDKNNKSKNNIDFSKYTKIKFISKPPPYIFEDDLNFFKENLCDVVVAKNSGQIAAFGKIHAARILKCPVIMINQPPQPAGSSCSAIISFLEHELK